MGDKGPPNTRELIAEGERLRSEKKGKSPKTTQLVRESEQLIRRPTAGRASKGIVLATLFVIALVGAIALYFVLS